MIFSEYSSVKSTRKTSIEVGCVESFEAKQVKSESISSHIEIENQEKVTSSSEVKSDISEKLSQETVGKSSLQEVTKDVTMKEEKSVQQSKKEESISMTLPISRETREKSAEDKLDELESKMKFVKMIRGTNVEREYIFFKKCYILVEFFTILAHCFISISTLIIYSLHIFNVLNEIIISRFIFVEFNGFAKLCSFFRSCT